MISKTLNAWLCTPSEECSALTNGAFLRWRYGGAFVKEYRVEADESHVHSYVGWLVLQGIELIDAFKPALLKENLQCLMERVGGLSRLQWCVLKLRQDIAASFSSGGALDCAAFEDWTEEKFFQEYPYVARYLDAQPAAGPSGISNSAWLRWSLSPVLRARFDLTTREGSLDYACWRLLDDKDGAVGWASLSETVLSGLMERQAGLSRLQQTILLHRPDLATSFSSGGAIDCAAFEAWTEEKFFGEYPHIARYLDAQPAAGPSGISNSAWLRWSLSPVLRARFDLTTREGSLDYACWQTIERSDRIAGARSVFTEEHLSWCTELRDGVTRLLWMLLEERADLKGAFFTDTGLDVSAFYSWIEESFSAECSHVYRRLHVAGCQGSNGLSGPALVRFSLSPSVRERFDLASLEGRKDFLCWILLEDCGRLEPGWVLNAESLSWLNEEREGLTRLQRHLLKIRADLRSVFCSNRELLAVDYKKWFVERFDYEYPILAQCMRATADASLSAGDQLDSQEGGRNSEREARSKDEKAVRYYKRITRFECANGERVINLIGYATAQLGIGEDVRMLFRALLRSGYRVNLIDISDDILSDKNDTDLSGRIAETAVLDGISVFCCTAPECERMLLRFGLEFFERSYCIGYFPWELTKWPASWSSAAQLVDRVWVSTSFIRESFLPTLSQPVIRVPLVVEYDDLPPGNRKTFGIDEQSFVCLFIFDSLSYMARKNPIGHVRAFKQAFSHNENACLLIKTMNRDKTDASLWQALLEEIEGDDRIRLINQTMDKATLLALYGSVDVYLSLHRSEGFGRTIAEAMLYAKPVVVSAYSGNLDFCNADNACLVPGELVAVGEDEYPWSEGTVWFEPDVAAAAGYLRQLFSDKALRRKMGLAGQSTMQSYSAEVVFDQHIKPDLDAVEIELGKLIKAE